MKGIFKVYTKDIKSISANIFALIVIIGLTILPALYAWFNIKSSWNPYGNLSKISIAIVNQDKGAKILDKNINIGKIAVDNLKENKTLDFNFVSKEEADKGLELGKYYASIEITKDFSENIMSVLDTTPKKPQLIYRVNEKRNAVAPKITEKSATLLQQEISKNFIEEVSKATFTGLNKLDVEIESQLPIIAKFEKVLLDVDSKTGEIKSAINNLYSGGEKSKDVVKNIKEEIPKINTAIDNGIELLKTTSSFIENSVNSIEQAVPTIKSDISFIKNSSDNLNELLNANDVESSSDLFLEKIRFIKQKEEIVLGRVNDILNFLDKINKNSNLNKLYSKLTTIKEKIQSNINTLSDIEKKINAGEEVSKDLIIKVKDTLSFISKEGSTVLNNMDTVYKKGFDDATTKLKSVISSANNVLNSAKKDMPKVKSILDDTSKGLDKGVDILSFVKDNMNDAEKVIHTTADKIRSLNGDEKLKEALSLLKTDAKKESAFLSDPVELIQERVYPVPNYGSAMSPFFTTLSLWVGGLILVSVLTTEVYSDESIGKFSMYIGKMLIFLTIGILQALVVTLGDIYILGTYNYSRIMFIFSGMFISIIFVSIIYTLVYVLGNVGKALGVILLVLQISSSGGTFPVEVTPQFFKTINPFMPFTYAIGLMREAVAGYVISSVVRDICILLTYLIVFTLIGSYISTKNRSIGEYIKARLRESDLVEK